MGNRTGNKNVLGKVANEANRLLKLRTLRLLVRIIEDELASEVSIYTRNLLRHPERKSSRENKIKKLQSNLNRIRNEENRLRQSVRSPRNQQFLGPMLFNA